MGSTLPLFPESASNFAGPVDTLYFYLVGVSLFFTVLIFLLIAVFAIKYRRRSETERPRPIHGHLQLELLWTVIPLIIVMTMFGWSAKLYFDMYTPPGRAMEIYVVGQQWMWKIQHPAGQREINELHVPVGRPVKLIMTSQDVIHSFYVPAFRVKRDVVPGRYTTLWFEATKTGEYHLFCAEYCGTEHSRMIGRVVVLDQAGYERWLRGGMAPGQSLAALGETLFQERGCVTCHREESGALGPSLVGLYGRTVTLQDGRTVLADEGYLRESILRPAAKIVAGYPPIMPAYEGQISEEGILQLIAYIRSLGEEGSR